MTDVIVIFHFGLFFALLRPEKRKRKFQKNEKKTPGGIIILHKCTKNDDHMLYYSCDMTHDRYNWFVFFLILGYFFPTYFFPPNSPKNQKLKKNEKISGHIIILHMCTKNYD